MKPDNQQFEKRLLAATKGRWAVIVYRVMMRGWLIERARTKRLRAELAEARRLAEMHRDAQAFFREALKHYDPTAQMDKAIEECDELSEALAEYQASSGLKSRALFRRAVIGEIADVLIMANQLRIHFGAQNVDEVIAWKIERQRKRMRGDGDA